MSNPLRKEAQSPCIIRYIIIFESFCVCETSVHYPRWWQWQLRTAVCVQCDLYFIFHLKHCVSMPLHKIIQEFFCHNITVVIWPIMCRSARHDLRDIWLFMICEGHLVRANANQGQFCYCSFRYSQIKSDKCSAKFGYSVGPKHFAYIVNPLYKSRLSKLFNYTSCQALQLRPILINMNPFLKS